MARKGSFYGVGNYGPASEAAKKFARELGVQFDEDVSAHRISLLIEEAKRTRPATKDQINFANDLGLEFDADTISFEDLSLMIDNAPPTEKMLEYALSLGIDNPAQYGYTPLKQILGETEYRLGDALVKENPTDYRVGKVVLRQGAYYVITRIGPDSWRRSHTASLEPFPETGKKVMVKTLSLKDCTFLTRLEASQLQAAYTDSNSNE